MKRNGQWSGPVVSHQGFMIFPQSVASQLTKGNKSMMSPRSEASGWLRILKAAQKPGLKGLKPQGVRHQSELKGCVSGFSYLLLLLLFLTQWPLLCPMSESLSGKTEGLQDNATRKKGGLLLTRVRAPATSNAVVRGQRAPSPSCYTNL